MTFSFVGHIFLKPKVVCSVKSKSSIITLVESYAPGVRIVHGTDLMEMDSISTNLKGLSNICQLNVRESACQ